MARSDSDHKTHSSDKDDARQKPVRSRKYRSVAPLVLQIVPTPHGWQIGSALAVADALSTLLKKPSMQMQSETLVEASKRVIELIGHGWQLVPSD